MKKLIKTIGSSKYYIHGANTKKEFNKILFWNCYYSTDLILKGRVYIWFFGKRFLFDGRTFAEKVPSYLEYDFENFKKDLEELGKPKFIVIYIDEPHSSSTKTSEEIKRDNDALMVVMASCNTGTF